MDAADEDGAAAEVTWAELGAAEDAPALALAVAASPPLAVGLGFFAAPDQRVGPGI